MIKMRLLGVPGEGFLCVLETPLDESFDRDVIVIPQNQIEEIMNIDKTPGFELITGNLALELKMILLQEQIAFFEDKEKLEWKIRNSKEFSEVSTSREEIETEWQNSLVRLRLLLDELKESAEELK